MSNSEDNPIEAICEICGKEILPLGMAEDACLYPESCPHCGAPTGETFSEQAASILKLGRAEGVHEMVTIIGDVLEGVESRRYADAQAAVEDVLLRLRDVAVQKFHIVMTVEDVTGVGGGLN